MIGLWYFAHPYTCRDKDGNFVQTGEEANFRLCCYRSGQLFLAGCNIYSPIAHTHPIHMATPEFLARHEHELWYQLDLDFIRKTDFDGIILAPLWETSKGCRMERNAFEDMGRDVKFYKDIIHD